MARSQSAIAGPVSIPVLYRLFFLYIEPVATAAGAYLAHFDQYAYMDMTYHEPVHPVTGVPKPVSIILSQLANMYLVFAINEALVLRATSDLKVWRVLLLGLLIADFGHIWSVNSAGYEVYYRFWEWNSMYWGNLGFVYVGAIMRSCFLLGAGLAGSTRGKSKR